MLDRISVKILKVMNKKYKQGFKSFQDTSYVSELLPKIPYVDVAEALWKLNDEGYVNGFGADKTMFGISLTYAGRKYFELHRKEILLAILKSFITPIAVSIITTLITLWITGIFRTPPSP